MTLVELVHGTIPWEDTGSTPNEVPIRVGRGERPDSQLAEATPAMRNLIQACWAQAPGERPTFPEVVKTLEEMCAPRESVQEYVADHTAPLDERLLSGAE